MVRPRIKTAERGDKYGLGIEIVKISGRTIMGHTGGFPGFITRALIEPKNELGIIVLTNSIGSDINAITQGIFETIYYFMDKKSPAQKSRKINTKRYEGSYRGRWGDIAIASVGNRLTLFSQETNSPMKFWTFLNPQKKDSFLIETESKFSSYGELARFNDFKKGRAQKLSYATFGYKRI